MKWSIVCLVISALMFLVDSFGAIFRGYEYPNADTIIALIVLFCGLRLRKKEKERKEKELHDKLVEEERLRRVAEDEERRRIWNESHGVILTKAAGVTFKNDDGVSRQRLLKDIYATGVFEKVKLVTYEYNGEPAIRIMTSVGCVGNIPANDVESVLAVYERINECVLYPDVFENDDDETVYRADIRIEYEKI